MDFFRKLTRKRQWRNYTEGNWSENTIRNTTTNKRLLISHQAGLLALVPFWRRVLPLYIVIGREPDWLSLQAPQQETFPDAVLNVA
jgi:hypothetical protein